MATIDYSNCRFESYKDILNSFNLEIPLILQIKRFMECYVGDSGFRKIVEKNPDDPALRDRLRRIGVEIDPNDLSLLWSSPEKIENFMNCLFQPSADLSHEQDMVLDLEGSPVANLWLQWLKANRFLINKREIPKVIKNQRFHVWRARRVESSKSELGFFADYIDHPLFAFELSKGCSVGCWFCGFSAQKLSGIFEYTPENRALWRDVVEAGFDLFGEAAGVALCYWATEPSDNPNYLDFLKDYQEITGATLCTATASPIQDPDWLRSLISFYKEVALPWPRISVLSVSMLRSIHETYTPEELRDAGLLMQMKDAPRIKSKSGRILNSEEKTLGGVEFSGDAPYIPQGSIACVSGFLVNMLDRTIKLISPCYASDRWPFGYRIFAEETFDNAVDYRATLERIIENNMVESITPDMQLVFRDDLKCILTSNGFTLLSPNNKHHIKGKKYHNLLGELISQGDKTYDNIFDILTTKGAPIFELIETLTKLFNKGLLDETHMPRLGEAGTCY